MSRVRKNTISKPTSPRNATDIKSFYAAYNLARDNNVQITHHYASWADTEKNWDNNDFVLSTIRNKGLEVSIAFDIIHTSVKGKLPDAFTLYVYNSGFIFDREQEIRA